MRRLTKLTDWLNEDRFNEELRIVEVSVSHVNFNFQYSTHNWHHIGHFRRPICPCPQHVLSHQNVIRHEHVSCSTWSPHHHRRRPSGYPLSCLTFDSKPSCRTLSSSRFFSFILNYDYVLLVSVCVILAPWGEKDILEQEERKLSVLFKVSCQARPGPREWEWTSTASCCYKFLFGTFFSPWEFPPTLLQNFRLLLRNIENIPQMSSQAKVPCSGVTTQVWGT